MKLAHCRVGLGLIVGMALAVVHSNAADADVSSLPFSKPNYSLCTKIYKFNKYAFGFELLSKIIDT